MAYQALDYYSIDELFTHEDAWCVTPCASW